MSAVDTAADALATQARERPWLEPVGESEPARWRCRACGATHEDPARLDPQGAHAGACWFREGFARLVWRNASRYAEAPVSLPSPPPLADILDRDVVRHGVTPKPCEWTGTYTDDARMVLRSAEGVDVLHATMLLQGAALPLAHAFEDRARLVELVAMLVHLGVQSADNRGVRRRAIGRLLGAPEELVVALDERGKRLTAEARTQATAKKRAQAEDDLATGRVRRFVRRDFSGWRNPDHDTLHLRAERDGDDILYVQHPPPASAMGQWRITFDEIDRMGDAGYVEEPAP